jgi:hypothetical protein
VLRQVGSVYLSQKEFFFRPRINQAIEFLDKIIAHYYYAVANLIVDSHQSQPGCGCALPCPSPVAAFNYLGHLARFAMAPAYIDQRSRDSPDHISKKSVGSDNYDQLVGFMLDAYHFNVSDVASDLRTANGEGGEIMLADERHCGSDHFVSVQLSAMMTDIAANERTYHIRSPYPISICFSSRRQSRMKTFIDEFDIHHANITVEVSIDSVAQIQRIEVALKMKVCDLTFGVNSGIGAARAVNSHIPTIKQ